MKRLPAVASLALLLPMLMTGFAAPLHPISQRRADGDPGRQAAAKAEPKIVRSTPQPPASEIPIRRVVLYKNGVGYFEHQGRVNANQELNIRFTTAQLNDVLKSLTVVDLNGGSVGSVRYNSIAPLSERLGTLRLALDGNTDRASFLNALRGARVEVHAGAGSGIGRLLSVEEMTRQDKDGNELKTTQISLVTDSGELRSFDLTPSTSVRILESEMATEVSRYMGLLASARDKDLRQMTISTTGEGPRDVVVSYISEVPVWKSTYRIVLPKEAYSKGTGASATKGDALLQGWAVVDNTVGEDWQNVQLSLVAGAPQSFVEPISQPYYVRRPVVDLPRTALLTPQTHEGTLNEPAAESESRIVLGAPSSNSVAAAKTGGVAGGLFDKQARDKKEKDNSRMLQFAPAAPPEPSTDALEQSVEAQASGETLGDMFEYKIRQNVTVLQNQSALVPIVQARVEAEKVTLWNERQPAPVRAVWLTNTSGLTLDAGSFNIVEAGAFAGEGLLAEIHPDERRLLSYAADTAVRVKQEGSSEQRPYTRLRAARGILTLTRELCETRAYTVSNSDTAARSVVIEHPARSGWHFVHAELKPEESSGSYHRFRVRVAPGASEKLEVAEYYPQQTTYALNTLDNETIGFILQSGSVQPEVEAALRKLLARKDAVAESERELQARREELARIGQEQARIRENMKTLKGTAEEKALLQRYVASLNRQEDQLAKINSEISAKEVELSARQREYQITAELIAFDQTR